MSTLPPSALSTMDTVLEDPPPTPSTPPSSGARATRRKLRERNSRGLSPASCQSDAREAEGSETPLSSPEVQNGTTERRQRRSGSRSQAREARSEDKQLLRKLQSEKAAAEADAEDLRRSNDEMSQALERERGLRKQGNRAGAESIAAAQAEVAVLRGQCKSLASRVHQVEAEAEAALAAEQQEHRECKQRLEQLQLFVKDQSLQQEQERTVTERSIVASRSQRDTLQAEKSGAECARQAAEQQVSTVVQRVQAAVGQVGDQLRSKMDALIEELAQAQYQERCPSELVALLSKLALSVRAEMDQGLSALEEVGHPPAGPEHPGAHPGEDQVSEESARQWRQMRDLGLITPQEHAELLSKLCPERAEAQAQEARKEGLSTVASKWSWRGGTNKRQEEVAQVVRVAQAQMLEELKESLRDREDAVYELQERLQEVQLERDVALQQSEASHRSSSHQRSASLDSCDFGEFSEACFTPKEHTAEALRLESLNQQLCECQELYLTLPKGQQRRELRVAMKELDRQCKHLQAQLSKGPASPAQSPQAVLDSALAQAEHIAGALEGLGKLDPPHSQRPHSTPSSPTHRPSPSVSPKNSPKHPPKREVGGWIAVKSALCPSVPMLGLHGGRTKASSLSALIQQRKANKQSRPAAEQEQELSNSTGSEGAVPRSSHERKMSY